MTHLLYAIPLAIVGSFVIFLALYFLYLLVFEADDYEWEQNRKALKSTNEELERNGEKWRIKEGIVFDRKQNKFIIKRTLSDEAVLAVFHKD